MDKTREDSNNQPNNPRELLALLLNIGVPKTLNVLYLLTWVVSLPLALVATYYGVKADLALTWYVATVAAIWVALWDCVAHLKYNLPTGPVFDKVSLLDKIMVNFVTTPILVVCYGYTLYAAGQGHTLFWPAVITLAAGGAGIVPFPYPTTGKYQNPHSFFHKVHMLGHAATPVLLILLIIILSDASA